MSHPTHQPAQKIAPIARDSRTIAPCEREERSEYTAHMGMRAHLCEEPELLQTIDLNLSIDWGY